MSAYNQGEFIKDFMERTQKNQAIINKKHEVEERDKLEATAFEITQKINSLFGFVIMPQERFNTEKNKKNNVINRADKPNEAKYAFDQLKRIIKECYDNEGYYNSYLKEFGNNEKRIYDIMRYTSMQTFNVLKHLRNSLAHGGNKGLCFLPIPIVDEKSPDEHQNIEYIIFYDYEENKETKKIENEFCLKVEVFKKCTKDSQLDRLIECAKNIYSSIENLVANDILEANNHNESAIGKETKMQRDYYLELIGKPHKLK